MNMLRYTLFLVFSILLGSNLAAYGQSEEPQPSTGWFFSTEASAMFHHNHVGRAVGLTAGVPLWKGRILVGISAYNRSGPINPHTETYVLEDGVTYKGQSELTMRADHGSFGVLVSPQFQLSPRWTLEVPLMIGGMGAGFYLVGEDRVTPDGRRVSEWEDDLFGDADAGFGAMLEGGVRVRYATALPYVSVGVGVHYTHTLGWYSTVGGDSYYRVPRVSLFLMLGK